MGVSFSSVDSDMTFQTVMHSCHTMKWRVSQIAHACKLVDYDQETVYGDEYQLQCIGNNDGKTGLSQSLLQVGPMNIGTERTLHASLSAPTEPIRGWRWVITSDEMWCHHREPQSKWQPMERQHVNSPLKEKFMTQPSVGKLPHSDHFPPDKELQVLMICHSKPTIPTISTKQ